VRGFIDVFAAAVERDEAPRLVVSKELVQFF